MDTWGYSGLAGTSHQVVFAFRSKHNMWKEGTELWEPRKSAVYWAAQVRQGWSALGSEMAHWPEGGTCLHWAWAPIAWYKQIGTGCSDKLNWVGNLVWFFTASSFQCKNVRNILSYYRNDSGQWRGLLLKKKSDHLQKMYLFILFFNFLIELI